MNNHFNIQNFKANNAGINLGGTIEGEQIGTQNYQATDPEGEGEIAFLEGVSEDEK